MNTKGFRVPPQPSKNDQVRAFDAELKNLQMASRISQMMTQQLMQSVKTMSEDLGSALNQLYELQYKHAAVVKALALDPAQLASLSNEQRLVDFNLASTGQDLKENLALTDEVGSDSTITLTTIAKDETGTDKGIFRSRIKLSECGVPDLISGLTGKKVGDKVQVKLNGIDHEVELLSIRNPTLTVATEVTEVAQEATH